MDKISTVITLWSTIAFSSAGDIDRERKMGTLKNLMSTPTNYRVVMFSKILGNTVLGCMPTLFLIAVAAIFFPKSFYIAYPALFVVSFIEMILSFMGISLVFAAIFTLSRETRIFMNCMEFPIYILCGFIIPVENLPIWIRWVSYILSPTWSVKLMKLSIEGTESLSGYWVMTLFLLVISVLYFVVAFLLLGRVEKRVRIMATLEVN